MKNIALNLIHKTHETINSEEFKEKSRVSEKQFTRNRKMSFQKTICFCLNFIKKSSQLELDDFVELLDKETESPITKQAFSKARQHILPRAFEELFLMTSKALLNNNEAKKYKGYRIFAIDGTELELSRSKELAKEYPPSRNTTAPRARVSILCEVLEGSVIHADMKNHKITMNVRVIKLTLPGGEEETLIRNLACDQLKQQNFSSFTLCVGEWKQNIIQLKTNFK